MKAAELIQELTRRQHPWLHHACTVGTFRSYCELGAYRSRHAVTKAGLSLTPQVSDAIDKQRGILDHLFLNIFDQHADVAASGRSVTGINKYGPLLMVFDVNGLARCSGTILGYKEEISSPSYSPSTHDVITLADFRRNTFRDESATSSSAAPRREPGTPGPNMCVHVADSGGIAFVPFLIEVIVDRLPPRLRALEDAVLAEVKALLGKCAPHAELTVRQCVPACDCRYAYDKVLSEDDVRRFFYDTNTHVYPKRLRQPR